MTLTTFVPAYLLMAATLALLFLFRTSGKSLAEYMGAADEDTGAVPRSWAYTLTTVALVAGFAILWPLSAIAIGAFCWAEHKREDEARKERRSAIADSEKAMNRLLHPDEAARAAQRRSTLVVRTHDYYKALLASGMPHAHALAKAREAAELFISWEEQQGPGPIEQALAVFDRPEES